MNDTATMSAVRAERFGPPQVLEFVDAPRPQPGPGEVLIRVRSAAVNYSDVMRRRASAYPFPTELPYVPGSEVAGEVEALGQGVEGPAVGTPVFAIVGRAGEGGYAQYAVAAAPQVIPMPPGLDFDVAAGIAVAGATAHLVLHDVARLGADETVYVPAAAGGVGSIAVQLAKHHGARVIAGASTEAKRRLATELGADATVDTSGRGWTEQLSEHAPQGVDVLLEMAGGDSLEQAMACVAPFGRVVVYGSAADAPRTLSQPTLDRWLSSPALGQTISAFNLGAYFGMRPQAAGQALQALIGLVASGKIRPQIGHVLPLREAADAHRLLERRASQGKIILHPWD